MTVDAGDIRFMRTFAGVPSQRRVVKKQCSVQHYYIVLLVLCRLSTDLKYVYTLQDLEWPFYVQFSIFTFTNRVSFIVELFIEYFVV